MAMLHKLANLRSGISILCQSIQSLRITSTSNSLFNKRNSNTAGPVLPRSFIHTTIVRPDLSEFFDDEKHRGENEVKSGRSWRLDELRIKSGTDLHKLWYVLLKERNMLLTMEHECNEQLELFPSPERLDKVRESMENLETVVRERNKAYHLLETGEDGERPGSVVKNELGINFFYRQREHLIPKFMNNKWKETHKFTAGGHAVNKFLLKYRERLYNEKRKSKNRDRNHVMHLMRRNPNINRQTLQNTYPNVNIDKLVYTDKIRGHYVPRVSE